MKPDDKLKLSITVDGVSVYFGAPLFLSQRNDKGEESLVIQTSIGQPTQQKIEIILKRPTYIEPITKEDGDISTSESKPTDISTAPSP